MLAKKPLTDCAIAALKPAAKGKRSLLHDALVPGFAVRVTDRGQRSFVLVTRYPGSAHPTARAIGSVGAISLEAARGMAREWLAQIVSGVDPAQAAEVAQRDTLRAVCEEYLARDGAKLRSAEWRRAALDRIVYPVLGSRLMTEVKRSDVVRLLDAVEDERGPIMANRTLALIRRVMNWYASRSDEFRSPIVRGMARPEQSRDRVLTDEELRAVWKATEPSLYPGAPSSAFCALIRFLLLTSARRSEAVGLRWAEIDGGIWTLPAARNKTGVELARPLSSAALAVVGAQPRLCEFVFSRNGQGAMGGIAEMKAALSYASGVKGWTLHDLRRTARSLMSRAGVHSDHAELCLGHVLPGIRQVYDRHKYVEEKRIAFEKLATLIAGIVDPQPNIVSIRGAAR
jgi:integrase